MSAEPQPLSHVRYRQAESPRWDARTDELYWVDLREGALIRGTIDGDGLRETARVVVGPSIGCAAPLAHEDGWVVAAGRDVVIVPRRGIPATEISCAAGAHEYFNDGRTDAHGRFWVGTQSVPRAPHCSLYSIESDGRVVPRLGGVTVSNGLAFTADGRTMYYIDTLPRRRVEAFAVARDGTLTWRRTVATIEGGNLDGMSIDLEGNLWVAVWDAGEVRHYAPDGRLIRTLSLPARRPTAVTLWHDLLVITTARVGLEHPTEHDGAIFGVQVPVGGAPERPWLGGGTPGSRSTAQNAGSRA